MKYLCLAYYDEKTFQTLSQAEIDALVSACQPYDEALRKTGSLVATGSLDPARSARTVRPRKGSISVTDGPFIETKEQIGGFFIVEARDLHEATRLASKHPAANLNEHLGWGLEVRPIVTFGRDSLICRLGVEGREQS